MKMMFFKAKSVVAMNLAMSFMYATGFWIPREQGMHLANLLLTFLQGYTTAAKLCLQSGQHRFGLMPKLHYLHHASNRLRVEARRAEWVINPMSESVQVQEDFIGRPSRLSRRVDVRQLHMRVMERSLIASQQGLEVSDRDERGLTPE